MEPLLRGAGSSPVENHGAVTNGTSAVPAAAIVEAPPALKVQGNGSPSHDAEVSLFAFASRVVTPSLLASAAIVLRTRVVMFGCCCCFPLFHSQRSPQQSAWFRLLISCCLGLDNNDGRRSRRFSSVTVHDSNGCRRRGRQTCRSSTPESARDVQQLTSNVSSDLCPQYPRAGFE